MDRDFLDAIWLQFETEAMEHCTSSEDLLLETEFNEYEAAKIDSLFRAFHSLKGLFGTVGLNKTLELTHLIEDVIDKIRSLEMPPNNKIRGALLKCIDVLKNIITSSSSGSCSPFSRIVFPSLEKYTSIFQCGNCFFFKS